MKNAKALIAVIFVISFIFNSFGQDLSKKEADLVWQMVETGRTEDTFWYLVDLYRRNGVDFELEGKRGLKLKVQDYREIINSYDNGTVKITLSRMMKPAETADYWENWNKVLAKGNFDQRKFFKNDRERFLMANFNVLVLAAHEIGHYLDYRYQVGDRYFEGGRLTTKTPMNCEENYADKFAVATINYLAQDARLAEIRPRYLELINYFNSSLPAENRYNFDSYDYTGEKCGTVDLLKNGVSEDGSSVNENFFRQYVSAYFNRHRLMLESRDYASLRGVIERELLEPYFKKLDYADSKFTVRTIRQEKIGTDLDLFYGGEDLRVMLEQTRQIYSDSEVKTNVPITLNTVVLDQKGEPKNLQFNWTAGKLANPDEKIIFSGNEFSLKIMNAGSKVANDFKITVPPDFRNQFVISGTLLVSDNEIIVVLTPFDLLKKFDHVVILQLLKTGGQWQEKFARLTLPDLTNADEIAENWFVTPAGKLNLLRISQRADKYFDLTRYEIDRTNFTAQLKRAAFNPGIKPYSYSVSRKLGRWIDYRWGRALAGNDTGRLLVAGKEFESEINSDNLFEIDNKVQNLFGNITGIADGDDPRRIRTSYIAAARFITENRLVFIDFHQGKVYLREVNFR